MRRLRGGKALGIPGKAWRIASCAICEYLERLFTRYLRNEIIPSELKEARLVLLCKEGRPPDSSSAYRPICLLDKAGMLFERVIARCLVRHLSKVDPDLGKSQYGYRANKSTVDAILRVGDLAESIRLVPWQRGVRAAVFLDIVSVFNSFP